MNAETDLLGPMKGAEHSEAGGVKIDMAKVGNCRVRRVMYPVGFRWSKNMKPLVGTDFCMHAHVGFLAQGEIHMEFHDGCVVEFRAPQVVAIEPGHDGWVVGEQPAVLVEFDFGNETASRVGLPAKHTHDK
jgi:hypothetical protein